MCTLVFSPNLFPILLLCPCGSFAGRVGRKCKARFGGGNFTKCGIWL